MLRSASQRLDQRRLSIGMGCNFAGGSFLRNPALKRGLGKSTSLVIGFVQNHIEIDREADIAVEANSPIVTFSNQSD